MNILNWTKGTVDSKKMSKRGRKIRKKTTDYAAKRGGPIGDIARQRKKHDKALEDIMKGM